MNELYFGFGLCYYFIAEAFNLCDCVFHSLRLKPILSFYIKSCHWSVMSRGEPKPSPVGYLQNRLKSIQRSIKVFPA